MVEYISKIQKISKKILQDGKVDIIIGFSSGSLPMASRPSFIKSPEDADKLIFDGNCGINLANYLAGRKEKIGIIAKGCDSRNIAQLIVENKIKREQLFIIGVPCFKMIDKRKISLLFEDEITQVTEVGDKVIVKGKAKEKTFNREDLLQANCITCTHHNPVIYDELAGELIKEPDQKDGYEDVKKIEAMSSDKRWSHFSEMLSACIRCYACRDACPLCYCPTCFVDEAAPQWVGKSADNQIDVKTFHILRAFHCAGRCTDCGACERACPMSIKVREFTRKLNSDAMRHYEWEAGLTTDKRPLLDNFRVNDYQDFIK
ncbi:MAG: 4Fe-4S dicluster domain-containing protein [Deltaproteobacteria bacterium]|nr:4Fe-4S dicluster domain-containing protein [Deltaproteobacteria bacterium]